MEKFKANPYNKNNVLINKNDIYNLFENLGLMNNSYFHKTFNIKNISLYQKAFVHTSYTNLLDYADYKNIHNYLELQSISYEKIEFLGDALLGSCISSYLYDRYVDIHKQDEGFLTKIKIKLVCGEQLAYLSKCIGFNKYAIISEHIDKNCDGRNNKNILEDIFEAFIGALYLDTKDINLINIFIITIIEKYVDFSKMILDENNFKEQLLKYFQHNYKCNPIYNTTKIEDNEYVSIVSYICTISNKTIDINTAKSLNKKKAEQLAARGALMKYHVIS